MKGKFIDVDLDRSEFPPVSVSAIFCLYSQKFNIPKREINKNRKKYTFSFCLTELRKLKNNLNK